MIRGVYALRCKNCFYLWKICILEVVGQPGIFQTVTLTGTGSANPPASRQTGSCHAECECIFLFLGKYEHNAKVVWKYNKNYLSCLWLVSVFCRQQQVSCFSQGFCISCQLLNSTLYASIVDDAIIFSVHHTCELSKLLSILLNFFTTIVLSMICRTMIKFRLHMTYIFQVLIIVNCFNFEFVMHSTSKCKCYDFCGSSLNNTSQVCIQARKVKWLSRINKQKIAGSCTSRKVPKTCRNWYKIFQVLISPEIGRWS